MYGRAGWPRFKRSGIPVACFEHLIPADVDHLSIENEDAMGADSRHGAEVGDEVVANDEILNSRDADSRVRRGRSACNRLHRRETGAARCEAGQVSLGIAS